MKQDTQVRQVRSYHPIRRSAVLSTAGMRIITMKKQMVMLLSRACSFALVARLSFARTHHGYHLSYIV